MYCRLLNGPGEGARTSSAYSPKGKRQVATPGSAVAHQLKGLPAFFSPYTRSRPKNGGTEMRTEQGGGGRAGGG